MSNGHVKKNTEALRRKTENANKAQDTISFPVTTTVSQVEDEWTKRKYDYLLGTGITETSDGRYHESNLAEREGKTKRAMLERYQIYYGGAMKMTEMNQIFYMDNISSIPVDTNKELEQRQAVFSVADSNAKSQWACRLCQLNYNKSTIAQENISIISHYSQSPSQQLVSICRTKSHLNQVILIGQKTETLEGIQFLESLTELWVVEAQLRDTNAVARCLNLTKLMLYSNELIKVPAFGFLPKLNILWLAGNKIRQIENMDGLPELTEINLANNKIESLRKSFTVNKKVVLLNLAANPITKFEEVGHLRNLRSLEYLLLSDPLYGPAPVARLCNYRSAVVFMLSTVTQLDGFPISTEEREQVSEFYEGKIRKLRTLANHLKAKATRDEREIVQQSSQNLKQFRNCCMLLLQQQNDPMEAPPPQGQGLDDLAISIRRWEVEKSEQLRHIRSEAKIKMAELELELQQVGNVRFVQHNASSHLSSICQDLLNRASCPDRLGSQFGVDHACVTSVVRLCDRAADILETWNTGTHPLTADSCDNSSGALRKESTKSDGDVPEKLTSDAHKKGTAANTHKNIRFLQRQTSDGLLLLLTNAERDLALGSWPLQLTSVFDAEGKESGVYVSNCLAAADLGWLKRLRLGQRQQEGGGGGRRGSCRDRDGDEEAAETAVLSGRQRLAAIVRLLPGVEFRRVIDAGCSGHSVRCVDQNGNATCKCRCRVYRITGTKPTLVFLVEFKYEFKEGTWPTRPTWWRALPTKMCPGPGVLNEAILGSCIGKPRSEWTSVTDISITARGVSVLGELPIMSSVRSLDLSYNLLGSLGFLYAFTNLRELNLRANNLVSLVNMRTLPHLQSLDISWNNIRRILPVLQSLGKHTDALRSLQVSHNPVEDILDDDQLGALASHYLARLQKLDNKLIKQQKLLPYPEIKPSGESNSWYYPLSLKYQASRVAKGQLMPDRYTLSARHQLLKGLAPSEQWAHVRWADLSGNVIRDHDVAYVLNVMVNIEEISLARNAIEALPLNTFQNCSKLVRLDISNNFLSSLASFSLHPLSALRVLDLSSNQLNSLNGLQMFTNMAELYVTNNVIHQMDLIKETLKSLSELKVLDLSGNPVATERSWIKLALFHLKKLESLNGMAVTEGDLQAARQTFGACLDRDALLRHFTWKDLSLLSELSLPRTGLKSVVLPGDLLPSLSGVDLSNNSIKCLWGLHDLPSLRTLNLANNQIQGLSKLNNEEIKENKIIFPSLATLYLSNNGLKTLAHLQLHLLASLRVLFLHGNRLTDWSGLPTWVTGLVLDRNKISIIPTCPNEETEGLFSLTDLFLEGNRLSDIRFVRKLQQLQRLFIARNQIQKEAELIHLTTLPRLRELTLQGNPVCLRKRHYSTLKTLLPDLARLDGHSFDPNYYLCLRQPLNQH